ncbi:MAG: GGDEF domain-containing protein [Proteobacteria bacterium]|nr:GGDEF domain-containing protein [Pseudomonadota bacterium]
MDVLPTAYAGRILTGDYSRTLQERTFSIIKASQQFDNYSFPLMPYITAWNQEDNTIWYEFVGQQLMDLLDTTPDNMSRAFRNAIQDQRIFHYTDVSQSEIAEEVITRHQISDKRHNLRKNVQKNKKVEAVYQVALPSGNTIWLKDRGKVELFPDDNITLTLGCLTDVSKEMEQKLFLEQIGYFDDLTGLPKRNILDKLFEIRTGERQRGYIKEFSVLMIDIDHFKSINDTYGHQAGDFILKEMATLISSLKRKEETIGRYGGEEFYGICRGTLQSGVELAERIRRNIERHVFTHNNTDINITISAGVASTEEMEQGSMDTLLALADKRLYQAKHQGRNKVIGKE